MISLKYCSRRSFEKEQKELEKLRTANLQKDKLKEEENKIYFSIEEIEIFQTNEYYMNQLLPYSSEIINDDKATVNVEVTTYALGKAIEYSGALKAPIR